MNDHKKTQEGKNAIYGDIKFCIVDINSSKKYMVSEHIPIAVGFCTAATPLTN